MKDSSSLLVASAGSKTCACLGGTFGEREKTQWIYSPPRSSPGYKAHSIEFSRNMEGPNHSIGFLGKADAASLFWSETVKRLY
jgi:hypothetical protein